MATTSNLFLKRVSQSAFRTLSSSKRLPLTFLRNSTYYRHISTVDFRRFAASENGDGTKKAAARLTQVQQLLVEAEERASSAVNETPPPKLSLEHVSVSFAMSGGPGGQFVNKVNTKVDMRFDVQNATWLSERIRQKIMHLEKNRINKNGEIVISSTKTRTQQGNIQDALSKLQAIIDAAAYVPPPPTEEQKKKIALLSAKSEQKRLLDKKGLSNKKTFRRSKSSWD